MSVIVKDKGWNRFYRRMILSQKTVKVGVMQNADPPPDSDLTMAELAAIHELGLGVPERPAIRKALQDNEAELKEMTAKLAKGIAIGRFDSSTAMKLLGEWGANKIRETIREGEGVPPPLADSTKEQKGSDRPLVDTGRLINAYSYEVE